MSSFSLLFAKKKVFLILVCSVLLIAVVFLLLHTKFVKSRILRYGLNYAERASGIQLMLQSFNYNLFRFQFTLKNVEFREQKKLDLPPFFQAEEIKIEFPLSMVLGRSLQIKDIYIKNPKINIQFDQDGLSNIPFHARAEAQIPEFILKRAHIEDGYIYYADEKRNIYCNLSGIWLKLKQISGAKHSLHLEMREKSRANFKGTDYPIDELNATAQLDYEGIDIEELALRLSKNKFNLTGQLDNFRSPHFNGSIGGELDLNNISRFLPINSSFSGKLRFRSHLQGPLNNIIARLKFNSEDLSFRKLQDINLQAEVNWEDETLKMPLLKIEIADGEVAGSGEFHPLDWKTGNQVNFQWKSINLEKLNLLIDQPFPFFSRTSGKLEASWPDFSLKAIKGRADIQLFAGDGKSPDRKRIPLSGHIQANADSGDTIIAIQDLSVPGVQIRGKVQLGSVPLAGQFKLEAQSLKALMPVFLFNSHGFDKMNVQKLGIDGQVSISGTLEGTIKSPTIRGELKSEKISFHNLSGIQLDGNLVYDSGSIRLEPLIIRKDRGQIEISGFYSLKVSQQYMHFDISGKQISLQRILKDLRINLPARSKVELEALVKGNLDDPIIQSSLVFNEASLYNQGFERAKLSVSYKKNKINVDSLYALNSGGKIEGEGWYDIKAESYAGHLSIVSLLVQDLQLPWSSSKVNGTLDLQIDADGILRSPRFAARGSLKEVTYGSKRIGDIQFQSESSGEELKFHFNFPLYSADIKGLLGLSTPYPLNAELKLNNSSLEELRSRIIPEQKIRFSGNLTAQVNINMAFSDPKETLNIQALIEHLQLQTGINYLKNEGPVIISYDPTAFRIESLELAGPGTSIQAEGTLPRKVPSDGGLWLKGDIDLALIENFFDSVAAQGILRIDSQVIGTVSRPELSATLDFPGGNLTLSKIPATFEDIKLHLIIEKNQIRMELASFSWEQGKFRATGEIPLKFLPINLAFSLHSVEEKPADMSIIVQGFDTSALKPFLQDERMEHISGKVDCEIRVRGKRLQLNDLSTEVSFTKLDLILLGVPLHQENLTKVILNNGRISIEDAVFSGNRNNLRVSGFIDLANKEEIDFFIDGNLDLKILRALLKDTDFSGETIFQFHVIDNLQHPKMQGFLEIRNGEAQNQTLSLFLNQWDGEIRFDDNSVSFEQIKGFINGGTFLASGALDYRESKIKKADITASCENINLAFPKGLRSLVSSGLKFESNGKEHLLKGNVEVISAKYSENFSIESAIYRYLRRGAIVKTIEKPDSFLSDLRFNVVVIAKNLLIVNNIANLRTAASLNLSGTFYNPALLGRADVKDGGEIYFSKNIFLVERGTINFINPNRIEPDMNLNARTRVGEYDIQLRMTGTPDNFSASLVSDPPLSEPNIISLLVTGRTLESASASVVSVAGDKALSYINGTISGKLEQTLAKSLGLESVKIDASLVSTQEDPRARITAGQHITRSFELIYSQDLKDARNRTWIINYNPVQNVNFQGVKRDNNEYNFALRHELLFGFDKKKKQTWRDRLIKESFIIEKILFEGNLNLQEKKIRSHLDLAEGKPFNFHKFQESLSRIKRFYRKNNYLSCSLNTKKEEKNGRLNLIFRIESGPKIFLKYQGADIPRKLKREIKNNWTASPFGQLVIEETRHRIQLYFLKKRYYEVSIRTEELVTGENEKVFVFKIHKGIRYDWPNIYYEGNDSLSKSKITSFLKKSDLISNIFTNPKHVTRGLEDFYNQNGFLRSNIRLSKTNFEPEKRKVHVVFLIREGPQFKVGLIAVNGNLFFGENQIINEINIRPEDVFASKKFNDANFKIKEAYAQKGFNNVSVESQIKIHDEGTVDLAFIINENQQSIIKEIHVSGNLLSKRNIIRRELKFKEDDVIDFRTINETRKRLYDLGIFEVVNIEAVPLGEDTDASSKQEEGKSSLDKAYRVEINVVELKPYRLRYGLQFDTETSLGIEGELINRNLLGTAQLLGTNFRINLDERDLRGFFRTPYFFTKKISTEFFTFVNRSIKPSFTVDRFGFTLQQQIELSKSYILSYNYTFERSHTFYGNAGAPLDSDEKINLGILNFALTRDTRDNIINASRGIFISQSFEYAPEFLASDVSFIRYFGQLFSYKKITDYLIYAFGLRLGLGKGLGADLVPSERFFAGGGTTIRGFDKDEIGPKDPFTGLPQGGDAVFILNQELRFPIYKKLSGAVFLDLGNIYSKAYDLDPFNVRKSAGFGLRFDTPFVLVRFDWGFKLDRRAGESLSEIFFSIGQAF